MLTLECGGFDECIVSFVNGGYKDGVFVVKDRPRFLELSDDFPHGVVNKRYGSIKFPNGKTIKFFLHGQDSSMLQGWRFQYVGIIDPGLSGDKMLYLISRMGYTSR